MIEKQGERLAAGGILNNAEMDWPHIAEEIESMGHAEQEQLNGRLAI